MLVVLGVFFVRRIQPIFIVSRLIMIVLLYSYLVYIIIGGYWFRYALVMVMLRGVLVVFTYIARLIPNERFERYNLIYIMRILILIVGGFYIVEYMNKWRIVSLGLWVSFVRTFNIFIIVFLLRIILVVVWLRYMKYGAVRI